MSIVMSGQDIDVWGGQETGKSYVPRPRSEDPCIVKVNGQCTCTPGFERCEEFAAATARIYDTGHESRTTE